MRLHRRDAMFRLGQVGLGALTLPDLLGLERRPRASPSRAARRGRASSSSSGAGRPARTCGTSSPTPPRASAARSARSPRTCPGSRSATSCPCWPGHADKLAVVRSMTHAQQRPRPSVYHMLTGRRDPTPGLPGERPPPERLPVRRLGGLGVLAAGRPAGERDLPRPIGHDGVTYAGTHAGFLGPRHDPMELAVATGTRSGRSRLPGVGQPVDLPEGVDAAPVALAPGPAPAARGRGPPAPARRGFGAASATSASRRSAWSLAGRASGPSTSTARTPGSATATAATSTARASCWPAGWSRPGVRLVTVNWMYFNADGQVANVWDTHGGIGGLERARPATRCSSTTTACPPLDRALSALLDDLDARGLLDETLVVAVGEFGRTPKINAAAAAATTGRSATRPCWPAAASAAARSTAPATSTPPTSRTTRSPPRTCSRRSTTPSGSRPTPRSATAKAARSG